MRWNFVFVINDYLFIETEGETTAIVIIDNNGSNNNAAETLSRLCEMSLYLTINDDRMERSGVKGWTDLHDARA